MMTLKVAFKTFGCRLNQLETESIADAFAAAGARICRTDEPADIYVVNTCTVTSKAEQKARRVIRQLLAGNPRAVALVTGCYAQLDREALALLHPRAVIVPGDEKSALLGLAGWLQDNWQGHGGLIDAVAEWAALAEIGKSPGFDKFAYHPKSFAFHSRPSLKIEDGCNNRCSYCRVCLARGKAVSLPAGDLLVRVRDLELAGKAEVVLTGVNLSQYRSDGMGFPGLLEYLAANTSRIRFRISSYEPDGLDESFMRAFEIDRVQPHVHLSAQSGSSSVLRRMARAYDAGMLEKAVAGLRKARKDPFIGADIIVGFPGESDAEFAETLDLCRGLDFAWMHVFPFSARPGTRAFDMKPKVPERVAGERAAVLAALAAEGKRRFTQRQLGGIAEVILERAEEDEGSDTIPLSMEPSDLPYRTGTSSRYLKVAVAGVPAGAGSGVPVKALLDSAGGGADIDAMGNFVSF